MSIKLIIFDMDGVIVDSREHHFESLNRALEQYSPSHVISKKDHLSHFDGLSTRKKLQKLSQERGLDTTLHDAIWQYKQNVTIQVIDEMLEEDPRMVLLFKTLKQEGYRIYICSNSIRDTVKLILLKLNLMRYVDAYISNEDVLSPKPHPEVFWQAMIKERVLPKETLIVEDSFVGRSAALASGANLCPVKSPDEVTLKKIEKSLQRPVAASVWTDETLTVIIPMSGAGSRFVKAGYTFPKPLIRIGEKPMIQLVVENLNVCANYVFIVRRDHYQQYQLESMLRMIAPGCKIIITDGVTEGACCSTLLAEEYINNEHPLLIANSDQYVEWESGAFFHAMNAQGIDGGILTFESTHPQWSYVRLDKHGNITVLKEKEVISNQATVGIYYWSRGADYVRYAKSMIAKNIRVNGEFYVAPVYNEAFAEGRIIKPWVVDRMWGLGTPEDLNRFLHAHEAMIGANGDFITR